MIELPPDLPEWLIKLIVGGGLMEGVRRTCAFAWSSLPDRDVFQLRSANEDELSGVREQLRKYVPAAQLRSHEEMTAFFRQRDDIYMILEKWNSKTGQLEGPNGIAIIYPLKRKVTDRLLAGEITAQSITPDDIFKAMGRKPSAYYLAFLWGATKVSQGHLCAAVGQRITPAGTDQVAIFARPTTNPALRFLQKNEFRTCGSGEAAAMLKVCYRSIPPQMKLKKKLLAQQVR